MSIRVLSNVLFRAPLLPARDLRRAAASLLGSPIGRSALALGSPDLMDSLSSSLLKGEARDAAARALSRYGRRAAFRPTPTGLLAGVTMGTLGPRTRIATGTPVPHLVPSWGRLAVLSRALVDEPAIRGQVRLRVAPSLLARESSVMWLAHDGMGELVTRVAEPDPALGALLAALQDWCPWAEARHVLLAEEQDAGDDDAGADEYLSMLVDQGLLHDDLCPPLICASPLSWMCARLAALSPDRDGIVAQAQAALGATAEACARGHVGDAEKALLQLPEGPASHDVPNLHGVLVHHCARPPQLSRPAVERAAALAPILFRLQQALSPPAAERALGTELLARLDGNAEIFGAGAFDLGSLAAGEYGHAIGELDDQPSTETADVHVVAWLAGALLAGARGGRAQIDLDAAALDALLPEIEAPPSFELVLSPAREPPRAAPGTDWLLGLHAPAGASLGRFAEALGAPLAAALGEIVEGEAAARPGESAVDVAFAASWGLADLCVHPPVRNHALALTSWSDGPTIRPADMEVVVDPAAAEPISLRLSDGAPLRPSPLHRVRSTTVPAGLHRLLAGWSFARQHAPWALSWGPLGAWSRLPRVAIDGFVIAPASWRIPDKASLTRPGFLAHWRRDEGIPAAIQIGEGDELLYVDLTVPGAAADLARHAEGRAWEIWPPLDRTVDEGGRRIEAVVAAVDLPDGDAGEARHAAIQAIRRARPVPPPLRQPPAAGWITFKIYGAAERQDLVLHDSLAPALRAAQTKGAIDAWFFVRYVEPGDAGRHHLRLRVHGTSVRPTLALADFVLKALQPSRAAGDVVAVEVGGYQRETARYGGAATMLLVERLFELDSDLVLALLAVEAASTEPPVADRRELLVRSFDALTEGLGLSAQARLELAGRRRHAFAFSAGEDTAALSADYRGRSRRLMALLSGATESDTPDEFTAALKAYGTAVRDLIATSAVALRAAVTDVLPAVLHMNAVRLCGPDAEEESAAFVLWQRTLESLAARRRGRRT